jgi:hypothetical protein
VLAQQQVGTRKRRRAAGDLAAHGFLKGAVHGAVVFLGPRVADALEHARAVPFERQAGAQSTKHQNLFSARLADVGKLVQRAFGLGIGLLEDGVEVAVELLEGDAGDLAPAEHAGLGAHAAHGGEREENLLRSLPDGLGGEADLAAQAFEDRGAAFIGQQVAGVLPEHQLERAVSRRQDRLAVVFLQEGDDFLQVGHAVRC